MASRSFRRAIALTGSPIAAVCPGCLSTRRRVLSGLVAAGAAALFDPVRVLGQAKSAGLKGPVVDFHAHMVDQQLLAIGGGAARGGGGSGAGAAMKKMLDPAAQLEDMDRFGIDMHVVSLANAIQGISWGDARTDLEIHRRINDEIASEWIGKYPNRFIGACSLPTQDLTLAIPELERCATDLKMKVVCVSSVTPDGIYYGDPRLRPFWDAVVHHNLTVFIHPHGNANQPPLDQFGMANSIGQGIEEAKVMGSIIYQGLFEKYPAVKILVAHGGGFLPHYTGRMDRNVTNAPESMKNITKKPSAYIKSFYYDSCVYGADILAALIKIVGAGRIVMGGDYPVGVLDPMAELKDTSTLSADDIASIAVRTPGTLLGLS